MKFLLLAALLQTCEPTSANFLMEWDASADARVTEYRIFGSSTSGGQNLNGSPHAVVSGTSFDYTTGPQIPDGPHYWVVVASDGTAQSSPTNEICTDIDTSPLQPPQQLRRVIKISMEITVDIDEELVAVNTNQKE